MMKKSFLFSMTLLHILLSAFSATVNPDGGKAGFYDFHFNKAGETSLWFYEGHADNRKSDFSFPSVSDNTDTSFELGIYYQIYEKNFELNIIFANEAYGTNTEGKGFMLAFVNEDGSYSAENGLNFNVEMNEHEDDPIVLTDSINLSEDERNTPLTVGERTFSLLSDRTSTAASNNSGSIELLLTLKAPDEGYTSGQYFGNIYLEYKSFS